MASSKSYDVSIVGGGIAGLSVALRLPENLSVALFTKGQLGESNTRYAQGGLTLALGADDSPELHFQDTIAAGAGLCNETAVRILTQEARAAVSGSFRWACSLTGHYLTVTNMPQKMAYYLDAKQHIAAGVFCMRAVTQLAPK